MYPSRRTNGYQNNRLTPLIRLHTLFILALLSKTSFDTRDAVAIRGKTLPQPS